MVFAIAVVVVVDAIVVDFVAVTVAVDLPLVVVVVVAAVVVVAVVVLFCCCCC